LADKAPIAVIDLGSNTAILLIVAGQLPLQVLHEEFRIPQLAKGMGKDKMLHPDSMYRAAQVLSEYKEICDDRKVEIKIVGGTAPFRKSKNPHSTIEYFQEQTGLNVAILSGEQEAQLSFQAATMDLDGDFAVVDVGGGSTELIWGTEKQHSFSVASGCIDLTETYFPSQFENGGVATTDQVDAAKAAFVSELDKQARCHGVQGLVGVAGTPTTIGMLELGLVSYDPDKLDQLQLKKRQIEYWLNQLAKATLEVKTAGLHIPLGRAEMILAGTIIIHTVMEAYNFDSLTIRTRGVRHGLAMQVLEKIS
jgi:exopolyphosphatase/guanosine-5'-triphosphate,3'-diphosphate pyrophosphatase